MDSGFTTVGRKGRKGDNKPRLAYTHTLSQFRKMPTQELREIYKQCVSIGVGAMVLGRAEEAIHYLGVAVTCRDIAAERFGGFDKGHARIRDEIAAERQRIVDFRDSNAAGCYKFESKLLVGNAMDAGKVVPDDMLPDGFDYHKYCEINAAQAAKRTATAAH